MNQLEALPAFRVESLLSLCTGCFPVRAATLVARTLQKTADDT